MFRRIGLRDPRRRQANRCLKAFRPANRPVTPCNKPENPASSRKIPWACAQPSQVQVSCGGKTGGDRGVLPIKASRWRTCPRIFAISGGSSMQAITLSLPLHSGQVSMSMAKTRLSRCIQLMGAKGLSPSTVSCVRCGTMRSRCLKFGAKTP